DRFRVNFQSPGSHLGKIEYLVDEMPEMARRCLDSLNGPCLLGRQLSIDTLAQKIDKSYYRIQWRAQFVRHIREEFAFHLVDTNQFGRQMLELPGSLLKPVGLCTKTADNEDENNRPDTNEYPAKACWKVS